jgi:subtilisin-like proprotein convertase family protein
LTLNGYTAAEPLSGGDNSADVGILLADPNSKALQIMRCAGNGGGGSSQNNVNITIADGGTAIPACDGAIPPRGNWTPANNSTWAPTAYSGRSGNPSPTYPIAFVSAAPLGSGTLTNTFQGEPVNGTWKVYLADDGDAFGADITFSSWSITITFNSVAKSDSTTSLSPNPSTAFTSSPTNSVTLTATVTSGATGTVTFEDGATNLVCTGGNPATLSGSQATCVTSFSTEGIHALSANYNGDSSFFGSTGTANVFIEIHSTNPATNKFCNPGTISSNGQSNDAFSNTTPYPSVVNVTGISNSVSTVSLILSSLSSTGSGDMHMLLVAPSGQAFDFWSNITNIGTGAYSIIDGSTALPSNGPSAGTFGPTAYGPPPDLFTPGPPAPAPQLPGSFVYAEPSGTSSFETTFSGATANGAWSLYLYDASGAGTSTTLAGWCLNITPASGTSTTTSVSPSTTFATLGQSVTFTATVTGGVGGAGTVTFTENGSPLVGTGSGVASVVSGHASVSTSSLPEGDHTITATYNDSPTDTFNESFGTTSMRVDKATSTPTLNGSTWSYCNTGVVLIPPGSVTLTDIGPAQPNPSNIFVTNLPGTIASVSLTLEGLHLPDGADILESLLVGPNGGNPPLTAQTLDFFSLAGTSTTAFGPENVTFEDSAPPLSCSSSTAPAATQGATSCPGPRTPYTASLFYTLPSSLQFATSVGSSTFSSAYQNSNPNGTWSLYFDQTSHATGGGLNGGWCMNFIENSVTVSPVKSHSGNFTQGQQGAQFSLIITNNGPGPTGDPDGSHPLTVTDVLVSDFTPGTLPTGTPWNCTASGQTVTCTSDSVVAQGSAYPTLTIPVNVSATAGTSDTNSVSLSGGGITATSSNTDTVTITASPVLSISKSPIGTFTQGQTAEWDVTVSNNAANGSTSGTTTVVDTLPTGYTLSSFSGTLWGCSGTGVTVTCTSSQAVVGGSSFNLLKLMVSVPAASPTSVTNNAVAFGGGDLHHTNLSNGATTFSTVTVVQVPATITINGTQTQSAAIGTAFGSLAVTVKDAGGVVIPNYSPVVFLATTGSNGQSGTFGNSTGTTSISANTSGIADPGTFTANGKVGSYSVGVTAGSVSNSFNLTNTGTAATITNVSSTTANGSYTVGAMINVSVTFSKAVNVTGTPLLALNSGGTASYVSGTGTATLSFLYTVGAGQNSTHLDATSSSALSLNGGTINDGSGTAAILTLPTPGAAGSLSANTNIVIDTTAPTVVSYSVDFGIESYNLVGASRTTHLPWSVAGITVVFSKPIATATTSSLSGITATGLSGLGTNTLTWTFGAITNATLSTSLTGSGANAIKDAAGNGLAGGAGFSEAFSVLYGDFNGDGVVNASDGVLVNNARSQPYNLFADINGDGVVNATDVNIVRTRIGTSQQ